MFHSNRDQLLRWLLAIVSTISAVIVVLVLVLLIVESGPGVSRVGMRYVTDPSWHPAAIAEDGRFNVTPMLIGTLAATIGAVVVATPLGLASALFCQFYGSRRLVLVYRRLIELLAGIPSVVYGFWGLVVLTPLIREWKPPGQSLLAGILILSIMILPTIALLGEASLASVPRAYLRGAAALGLSRWTTIRGVVMPAARSGLYAAVLLAVTRAVGETMAVLMVTGNVVRMPSSVFDPMRTLTANIALELGYATGDHRAALFVTGLMLMTIVMLLVAVVEWFNRGRVHV
jgi:phosphate transport system permease protein